MHNAAMTVNLLPWPAVLLIMLTGTALVGPARAVEPLEQRGYDHFYNLEYDPALRAFEADLKAHPDSPLALSRVANTLLYRSLYRAGALESDLVGKSNSFLRRPRVAMADEDERRFNDLIGRAIATAEERVQRNPNDANALYALGVAYGLRGNHALLVRKAYWDALRDGSRSRTAHDRLRRVQPENSDALLIPGLHQYITGSLPRAVRLLGSWAGLNGSREEGLRLLEEAARRGQRTQTEARVLLALLYRRERQADKAVPHLRALVAGYPRNYLYRSELAVAQVDAGQRQEAVRLVEEMDKLKAAGSPALAHMTPEKLLALRGTVLFRVGDLDGALPVLRQLAEAKGTPLLASRACLRLGQIHDLRGRREEAKGYYRQAIALGPDLESAQESQHYLQTAYRGGV